MSDERNYDGTGASAGSGNKFINIKMPKDGDRKDTCYMVIGKDGKPFDEYIGYLENALPPVWRAAEGDLPARYEYGIIFKSKDPEDGQVKDFQLSLSSHWKSPIVSDILNPLLWAATAPGFNKLCRIRVYAKKPKPDARFVMRGAVSDGNMAGKVGFMTCKFPWVGDKDNGHFEGVPSPETMSNGTKDWESVSRFWHAQYCDLVKFFNPSWTPEQPASSVPISGASTAPAQQATAQTSSVSPLAEKAFAWMKNAFTTAPLPEQNAAKLEAITKEGFAKLAGYNATDADYDTAIKLVTAFAAMELVKLPPGQVFDKTGTLVQGPPPAVNPEDIPF